MASVDPQLKYIQATAAGVSIDLAQSAYEVQISARNFGGGGTLCYIGYNEIPAAASQADDRIPIATGETINITGNWTKIGLKMDAGTCDINVVVYETPQQGLGRPQ